MGKWLAYAIFTFRLRLIKLRCLLAVELMLSMCLFHLRSDWIVTPRYFVERFSLESMLMEKLEMVQCRAARYTCNRFHNTNSVMNMLTELKCLMATNTTEKNKNTPRIKDVYVFSFTDFEFTFRLRLIKLRCLLAVELMLSMCLFHLRSDWIVTLRYFVEDSDSITPALSRACLQNSNGHNYNWEEQEHASYSSTKLYISSSCYISGKKIIVDNVQINVINVYSDAVWLKLCTVDW
jgi:outer membrane lipopolysaccharide assembly protein LptE/RlpB